MQTAIDDSRFNIIAQSYDYAIATYPDARKDGDWLMETLDVQPKDVILEISAGTGFLTQKIAALNLKGTLFAQDIAPRTLHLNREKNKRFDHIRYITDTGVVADNSCDKAVSLGGWHHMEDQIGITQNAMSKLKPGGYFCMGDFADNSSIQRYFDEVVDNITETGHQALFPSYSRLLNIGRFAKASSTEIAEFDVAFHFDNSAGIGEFFQKVFALDQDPEDTYKDVEKYFEIKLDRGQLAVMVPYVYAKYTK